MNFVRKATSSLALLAITSSMFISTSSAYNVAEVEAANKLADAGIIVKQIDPVNYQLDRGVLRQEIAAVARGLAKINKTDSCVKMFKDVTSTTPNGWACYTVEALANNNLIAKNPYFRPEAYITKAESVGMIVKAVYGDSYQYNPTVTDSWQKQVVDFAVSKGIVSNFSNYNVNATRGFIFEMGAKALDSKDLVCSLLGECGNNNNNGNTSVVNNNSEAEVTLSPNTTPSEGIPQNTGNTEFLKFNISAGKEDLKVNSITFQRLNLGNRTDFDRLWLTQDGVIVTRSRKVSSNDTFTLELKGRSIKAGTTEEFTLNAAMENPSAPTNTLNQFKVLSVDASSPVKVNNVVGNVMRTITYDVAELKMEKKGFDTDVNVGAENAILGEFKLSEVNTESKKDVILKSMRFKASGGADVEDDFKNLAIYSGGKKVSTETIIDGKYVTFKLNDFLIENGSSDFFEIKGDIVGGVDKTTINFNLQNGFDIYAVEKGTGIGVAYDQYSKGDLATYTLNSGRFIVSRDPSSPISQNVLKSTSDVTMLVAKIDLGQPITVDKVYLDFNTNINSIDTLRQKIDNVSLYVNDRVVASVDKADSLASGDGKYIFDDNFDLKDNDKLTVKVNFTEAASPNDYISFSLDNSSMSNGNSRSFKDIEYLSNGDTLKKDRILGSASGQRFTVVNVQNASIVRNDGYTNNQTMIVGEQNVVFEKFVISAPSTTSLNVRKLVFSFKDSNNSGSSYGNFRILTKGSQVGETSVIEGNELTVNGVNTIIPKNGQQEFMLVGDVKSSAKPTTDLQFILEGSNGGNSVFFDSNGDEITTIDSQTNLVYLRVVSNASLVLPSNNNYGMSDKMILGNTVNNEIAKIQLSAQDGQVDIDELALDLTGSDPEIESKVQKLDIYADGKLVKSIISPKAGVNSLVLGDGNRISVFPGRNTIITVKADINYITNNNNPRNSGIKLVVSKLSLPKIITKATGDASVGPMGLAINGKVNFIVKSYPTVSLESLPNYNLGIGQNEVYRFSITASDKGNIKIGKLAFNYSATTGAKPNISSTLNVLRDLTNNNNPAGKFKLDSINSRIIFEFDNPFIITAGAKNTFSLKLDLGSGMTKDDSFTISLLTDGNNSSSKVFNNARLYSKIPFDDNFVWSDSSWNSDDIITVVDWFNGYSVPGIGNMDPVKLIKN